MSQSAKFVRNIMIEAKIGVGVRYVMRRVGTWRMLWIEQNKNRANRKICSVLSIYVVKILVFE